MFSYRGGAMWLYKYQITPLRLSPTITLFSQSRRYTQKFSLSSTQEVPSVPSPKSTFKMPGEASHIVQTPTPLLLLPLVSFLSHKILDADIQ